MDILINAANVIYVIAYFTLDMLRLRLLTVTAACCLAVYFYCQPEPMLNVVAWNLVFVALNLTQIARIVRGRVASRRAARPLPKPRPTGMLPPQPGARHGQPIFRDLDNAVRDAAIRGDRDRAFPARL